MIDKFTVKRSEWSRGNHDSQLLKQGKRCCLGFLGRECGISNASLQYVAYPFLNYTRGDYGWGKWPTFLIDFENCDNSEATREITRINDDPTISESLRERELKKAFAKHNIEIQFED